ncbi:MAG: DUF2505 domain-containing protein [Myxococcales bacterium]|nr:DUF2505 domain-containing protein [Myxococcales bacterium]
MEFRIKHELAAPVEQALVLMTQPDFLAKMDKLLGPAKELLEDRTHDDGWVRSWRIKDTREKPVLLRKWVGSAFEYILEQRLERSRYRWAWKVAPSMGADRVVAEGYEQLHEASAFTSCREIFGRIEVKAPLFGKQLASFVGEEVRKSYEKAIPTIEEYVRVRVKRAGSAGDDRL